jgi:hypothetical protein
MAFLTASCDYYTGTTGIGITTPPPAAASKLAFTVQPTTAAAGVAISPPVQVAIQNASNGTVTTATNTVTLSITAGSGTSGAVLTGTRIANAVGGVATFSGVSVDRAGSGYTLTATSSNLASATSNGFNVNP